MPAADAARPGAAGRLRHLLAGRRADRRLLPLAARARTTGRPRAADDALGRRRVGAPAVRQAARAPRSAGPHPRGDPGPRALPPRPLRLDRARAGGRRRARHPGPRLRSRRWPTSAPRAARASCSRAPACSTRSGSSGSPAAPTRSPRSPACAPLKPELQQVVLKLDAGVSGEGNALIDLRGATDEQLGERFDAMAARGAASGLDVYLERLSHGGIVEERIVGAELRSPSVQLELGADGADRLHARPDPLRPALPRLPLPGRARVRARDHRERAPDRRCTASTPARVAVRESTTSSRATTTAPGRRTRSRSTCAAAGRRTRWRRSSCSPAASMTPTRRPSPRPCGSPRHYVATDHLESPRLRALGHGGLLRLAALPRLAADGCGVVFHMLSALDELGRVGLTAIGSTAADAQSRFEHAQELLLDAAARVRRSLNRLRAGGWILAALALLIGGCGGSNTPPRPTPHASAGPSPAPPTDVAVGRGAGRTSRSSVTTRSASRRAPTAPGPHLHRQPQGLRGADGRAGPTRATPRSRGEALVDHVARGAQAAAQADPADLRRRLGGPVHARAARPARARLRGHVLRDDRRPRQAGLAHARARSASSTARG